MSTRFTLALSYCFLATGAAYAQSGDDVSYIRLPDGFTVETWAADVPNARSLTLGDDGTVYVATRRDGRVFALRPQEDAPPERITVAEDLRMPNGIAWYDGALYVAENHRILRYPGITATLPEIPGVEVVVDDLPTERHHGWRYIDFGPDGKLYLSIGAPCNVCERDGFAVIVRMNSDGSNRETVAQGIRNSVGFAWHPDTRELWFTDNGRDMLGDDLPPGELNRVLRDGMHFGFPYCHGDDIADPEYGDRRSCVEFTAPAQALGPHVAPLGMLFYTGSMFPAEYRGQAFIAEHGSWNRTQKIGYRITLVRIEDGRAAGYEVFADGWLQGEEVLGRPVDLLQLADGSVLVSDDQGGVIYRISYTRPLDEGISQLPVDDTAATS